jgi:hypothetical protein
MVYTTYGRAGIYVEYCRLLGVGATKAELQDLYATLQALSSDHPIAGVSKRANDFSNPDATRSGATTSSGSRLPVPELYAWLERCGLSFGRWVEQAPHLPQCGVIARMPHAARLISLSPQLQHAAVELSRGTMTKHNFIAYRVDRPSQTQPITFDGDDWRGYVPLRLPWVLSIRDRVPPGCTAILINRTHNSSDLAFPIDEA